MQITSRFTVALHIFTCVEVFGGTHRITSDFLAKSIRTNPVIVRKILTQLRRAGLITVSRGTGGIAVTRPVSQITFYDVYRAVEPLENGVLFRFHEDPNPDCPVGRNIHGLLDGRLRAIQSAMEDEMRRYTVEDLREGALERIAAEGGRTGGGCPGGLLEKGTGT